MKFVFVCPEKDNIFESNEFKVIEDRGIFYDESGNRTWDAKVELALPCPFCGEKHIFKVSELPCPFSNDS